jgi:hypothetical protein
MSDNRPRTTLVLGAAMAGILAFGPSALAGDGPSSNGHGTYTVQDEDGKEYKRQFSFAATTKNDGTVNGNAEVHNPAYDFAAHIDLSCLLVDGNRASMGGTVTKSNDPGLGEGTFAFFTVYDNGEPGVDKDTISATFFDTEAPPPSCLLIGANDFNQTPIEAGNIQVKPAS